MKGNYKPENRQWDRFKAFHSREGLFTTFETGEVRVDGWKPDPHERRFYGDYNVTIASTADNDGIVYLHPFTGKQIPRAQLTYNGQQILLIDHDTNKAVKFTTGIAQSTLDIPIHLLGSQIYMHKDGGIVHGAQIDVNAPFVTTQEMLDWKNTVQVIAKMRQDVKKPQYFYSHKSYVQAVTQSDTKKYSPSEYIDWCLDENNSYNKRHFHNINDYGIRFSRDPQPLDYVLVEPRK